jgi:hypothetical protein
MFSKSSQELIRSFLVHKAKLQFHNAFRDQTKRENTALAHQCLMFDVKASGYGEATPKAFARRGG